jgi:Carboxypeptidase regulatory-like domain
VVSARIAAIAFTLLPAILVAQPAPSIQIALQVTDRTGAGVRDALITTDPSPNNGAAEMKTDSQGKAVLDLSPGIHILTVTYPGFQKWTHQIDTKKNFGQSIVAVLELAGVCSPCVTISEPEIPLEPLDSFLFIPLRPVQNLIMTKVPARTKHS